MAFENISKGEFESIDSFVRVKGNLWSFVGVKTRHDAEFIAYCFNLQQRYDISRLEEAVKAIENISFSKKDNYSLKMAIYEAEQLLKEIKK